MPGTSTAGHVDTQGIQTVGPTHAVVLARQHCVSTDLSHHTHVYTTPVAHVLSLHTPPHAHPTHMLSLLYSPSHRPFTCTASAHPSQTAAHTLRLRHTLWPHSLTHPGQPGFRCSCTQRTPRGPCSLAPFRHARSCAVSHSCTCASSLYTLTWVHPPAPGPPGGMNACTRHPQAHVCTPTSAPFPSYVRTMCVLSSALHHALSRSHQTIIQKAPKVAPEKVLLGSWANKPAAPLLGCRSGQ